MVYDDHWDFSFQKMTGYLLPLLSACLLSFGQLHAQSGFPTLIGEDLNGKTITVPDDTKGKVTLVALAYGKKAQAHLEGWYEPAYLRFIKGHGLFAASYDVNLYFIPMFVGTNKAAYGPTLKRISKSAEPEIREHILFFKGELQPYEEALKLEEKHIPYFFVLDEEGRIIESLTGAFTEDKLEAIEDHLIGR